MVLFVAQLLVAYFMGPIKNNSPLPALLLRHSVTATHQYINSTGDSELILNEAHRVHWTGQ